MILFAAGFGMLCVGVCFIGYGMVKDSDKDLLAGAAGAAVGMILLLIGALR